jgi:hypothetical protein
MVLLLRLSPLLPFNLLNYPPPSLRYQPCAITAAIEGRCAVRSCVKPEPEAEGVCDHNGKFYPSSCVASSYGICECATTPSTGGRDCARPRECALPGDKEAVCANGVNYGSSCVAASAGICKEGITEGPCPCMCPKIYEPVCANGVTYANECDAQCAVGIDEKLVIKEREKLNIKEKLDMKVYGDDVEKLSIDDEKLIINEKLIIINKKVRITDGPCKCMCEKGSTPVCANAFTTSASTYASICDAECAGIDKTDITDGGECSCPATLVAPVCANRVTYASKCKALLIEGIKENDIRDGECPACMCTMEIGDKPVCAAGKPFDNKCKAECAGYQVRCRRSGCKDCSAAPPVALPPLQPPKLTPPPSATSPAPSPRRIRTAGAP